ncbi:MAG TPA: ComF family protein [Eubacteriales bacterium]|nr:ComF family protein [Eubacteriales bacterium]HRU84968.1 ComF family protein [Eubacteriales bacterium]
MKTAFFEKLKTRFFSAVFPEGVTCDLCGAELIAPSRYNLCSACLGKMPFVGESKCLVCGAAPGGEGDYCLRCMKTENAAEKNRSPVHYEGFGKDFVVGLKYGGKKYLAAPMSAMMADTYIAEGFSSDIITYVPMTGKEKRQRGFNQAELLAAALSKRLNLPIVDALKKSRETKFQKELGFLERAENLKGAFSASSEAKGKRVLVVDDVFTTGATVHACAKALLGAGAKSVESLTFAVTQTKLYFEPANTDRSDKKGDVKANKHKP